VSTSSRAGERRPPTSRRQAADKPQTSRRQAADTDGAHATPEADAGRCFDSAHIPHATRLRDGVAVAHISPVAPKGIPAAELAHRWSLLPHLSAAEAAVWDAERANDRKRFPLPSPRWEESSIPPSSSERSVTSSICQPSWPPSAMLQSRSQPSPHPSSCTASSGRRSPRPARHVGAS